MNPEIPTRLATLLEKYYMADAADLQKSDRLEDEILKELEPRIRRQLAAERFPHADAEDIFQESQVKIVKGLHRSRDKRVPITHIMAWTRVIVDCIIKEEVRRTKLEYCMKRDVRHLVAYSALKTLLARWQIETEWLIGLTKWRGKPFRKTPEYAAFCHDDTEFVQQALEGRNPANTMQVKLPELLLKFLQWVQTPLEEPKLVEDLLRLRAKTSSVTLSLETLAADGHEEKLSNLIEPDVRLNWERYWQEVCNAPLAHRVVFLLALTLKELIVLTSAADPRACVAAALEIDPVEMKYLWERLPLSEEEIADRCNTNKNNIQQRRFRMVQRLKRLKEPPSL